MNKSKPNKRPRSGAPKSSNKKPKVGKLSRAGIASARSAPTSRARMSSNSKGSHVEHREFVGTVNGSIAFTANKFVCNPGMSATFPWLSVQARQWEQYRFNKLRFRYLTRTATTTVGSVLMAPDYDPTDAEPASEAAVSAYQDCVEDAVWVEEIVCELNPASMFPNGAKKFVRSGSVGMEDLKLYDAANFFLCTLEEVGTNAIGKLWVEYDVDFFVPQIISTAAPAATHTSYYEHTTNQALVTAVAEPLLLQDVICDPLGFGTPSAAGIFSPARGSYLLQAFCSVDDSVAETLTLDLRVFQNGGFVGNTEGVSSFAVPAGGQAQLQTSAIVNVSDGDTIEIRILAVGAAGVLRVPAPTQCLIVTPA